MFVSPQRTKTHLLCGSYSFPKIKDFWEPYTQGEAFGCLGPSPMSGKVSFAKQNSDEVDVGNGNYDALKLAVDEVDAGKSLTF